MQERILIILIIIGLINIIFTAINITVTERNTKTILNKKLEAADRIEREILELKSLMALQAFMEMSDKDKDEFIDSVKKEMSKDVR